MPELRGGSFGRRDNSGKSDNRRDRDDYRRDRGGGLRGRSPPRRDSYDVRPPYHGHSPPPRYDDRRPPYRGRSRSRSPPRRYDERGPPRRESFEDDRSRLRDSLEDNRSWRRDSFDGWCDSQRDERRSPPPPKEPPRPDEAEWTTHLTALSEDDAKEPLRIAGCVLKQPEPPEVPYWRAVELGDTAKVEALLDGGADVDQKGGAYGSTALGWAALASDTALLRLLLARGANSDSCAAKGSYPLHMAVWNGDHADAVRLLLEAGASALVKNAAGQTPLQLARWFDSLDANSSADDVFGAPHRARAISTPPSLARARPCSHAPCTTPTTELSEWRDHWGRPAGRSAAIGALDAAEDAARDNGEGRKLASGGAGESAASTSKPEEMSAEALAMAEAAVKDKEEDDALEAAMDDAAT